MQSDMRAPALMVMHKAGHKSGEKGEGNEL